MVIIRLIGWLSQVQELSMIPLRILLRARANYLVQPVEHKKIVDAIVAGDSEAARKAASDHINTLRKFVVEKDKETA